MNPPDTPDAGSPVPSSVPLAPDLQLPDWAKGRFTLEELQEMANDENPPNCLELKDFIEELRVIVRDAPHGR